MIETFAICLGAFLFLMLVSVGLWRWGKRAGRIVAVTLGIGSMPFFVIASYLGWFLALGQPAPEQRDLRAGMTYERLVMTVPRKIVAHMVTIDLALHPRFAVTPPVETPQGPRSVARLPSEQIRALDADLLINGSFFGPFRDSHLLDYYPHEGDRVQTIGTSIGEGKRYGMTAPGWVPFWADDRGKTGFGDPPRNAVGAISGRQWLVRGGKATTVGWSEPYPRTVIGFDRARAHLTILVVDGKQPRYSRGMTYPEVQSLLLRRGVTDAIELDGGGSSTLLYRERSGRIRRLNRPCHTKIPWRERPTANCLGIRFP